MRQFQEKSPQWKKNLWFPPQDYQKNKCWSLPLKLVLKSKIHSIFLHVLGKPVIKIIKHFHSFSRTFMSPKSQKSFFTPVKKQADMVVGHFACDSSAASLHCLTQTDTCGFPRSLFPLSFDWIRVNFQTYFSEKIKHKPSCAVIVLSLPVSLINNKT